MNVILCLGDNGGMMFNRRRQSRDRVVIADILRSVDGPLYMAEYSKSLFEGADASPVVTDEFLTVAGEGDWCFVEDRLLGDLLPKIHRIMIYWWNRNYPADLRLDIQPEAQGFRLIERTEFAGYSHETITKEIFER